jgi:transcriptional regulator with XRE-family HTH domain
MPVTKWRDLKRRRFTPEQIERIDREARAESVTLTLRQLREEAGMTQVEMAGLADITQSALSRIERREDQSVETVRRYVEALGGELELVAVMGNKRIKLLAG